MSLFAVLNMAAAMAHSFLGLAAARVLLAFAAGLYTPNANALAGALVPAQQRGRAIAVVNGGLTAAIALGVPLGAVVGERFGWRMTFVGVGVLSAIATAGVARGLPRGVGSALVSATLGERLSALTLPESVRTCELRSGSLVPRVLSSNHLWQPGEHGGGAGAEASELIERLRARLGPEAVYGLQVLPAHRPEKAWGATEPPGVAGRKSAYRGRARASHAAAPWLAFRRPTWLLPAPQLLSEREGMPRRRGPLRFLSEPERIETGWWDGGEVARDYYMAVDIHGVRLWVFRERVAPHRWFLHGVFG